MCVIQIRCHAHVRVVFSTIFSTTAKKKLRGRPRLRLAIMHSPLMSSVVVVICPSSLRRTIKIWDLAAALDAGSASDAICITTLKVGDLRVVLYLRVGEVFIFVGISTLQKEWLYHFQPYTFGLALHPGLPCPDFISGKISSPIFLHSCKLNLGLDLRLTLATFV